MNCGSKGSVQLRAAGLQPYSWRAVRVGKLHPPPLNPKTTAINLNLPYNMRGFYCTLPLFLNSLIIRKAIYHKGLTAESIRETRLPHLKHMNRLLDIARDSIRAKLRPDVYTSPLAMCAGLNRLNDVRREFALETARPVESTSRRTNKNTQLI